MRSRTIAVLISGLVIWAAVFILIRPSLFVPSVAAQSSTWTLPQGTAVKDAGPRT